MKLSAPSISTRIPVGSWELGVGTWPLRHRTGGSIPNYNEGVVSFIAAYTLGRGGSAAV